jgi:hypothetical protein
MEDPTFQDDVVHDDHERMRITRTTGGPEVGPVGDGTFYVMAGANKGGVSARYHVQRCPGLDKPGRRAWSPV